jgi:hypothetical protein
MKYRLTGQFIIKKSVVGIHSLAIEKEFDPNSKAAFFKHVEPESKDEALEALNINLSEAKTEKILTSTGYK